MGPRVSFFLFKAHSIRFMLIRFLVDFPVARSLGPVQSDAILQIFETSCP